MTCLITGTAGLPSGAIFANGVFTFTRAPKTVQGQSGRVVSPAVVSTTSDGSGAVSFSLLAGNYVGHDAATDIQFNFVVPDEATANFVDCVDAAALPVTPDVLLQAQEARDQAVAAAASVPMTVASVAALKALDASSLIDGSQVETMSYIAGARQGGNAYIWDAGISTADNGVTIIAPDAGGTGRYRLKHNGTLTMMDAGAVSNDGGDHTAQRQALVAVYNSDMAVRALDFVGIWNINGGGTNITRARARIVPSGYSEITRTSDGILFRFTGDKGQFTGHELHGGAYTGHVIVVNGPEWDVRFNTIDGGLDNGITTNLAAEGSNIDYNRITDSGGANIGMGNTPYLRVAFNDVSYSGPESIQGNGANRSLVLGNRTHHGNGVGNFGGTGIYYMTYAFNMSYAGNSGFQIGNKGITGSYHSAVIGNMFVDNDKWGMVLQNYRRSGVPIGITNASPAVVTFARKAITGATNDRPIVVTCVGHGFADGAYQTIHDVGGMIEINGETYQLRVIDADHVALLDQDTGAPIVGGSKGVYTTGGFIDHGFAGDRGFANFSGITGMTEINGETDAHIRSRTNDTITLEHGDETDFSTIGYGTFTGAGSCFTGEMSHEFTVMGNVAVNNPDGNFIVQDRGELTDYPRHYIGGNISGGDGEDFFFNPEGSAVINQQVYVRAAMAADVAHAEYGDGTKYVPLFTAVSDVTESYDSGTGKVTLKRSGMMVAQATVALKNAANATGAYMAIRIAYPDGTEKDVRQMTLAPVTGEPTSDLWRGSANIFLPVQKETRVFVRYWVTGLPTGVSTDKWGIDSGGDAELCSLTVLLV